MKLYLKQKVFSWRDRFYVKSEDGQDRYYVEGELLSWGKKLHIYNIAGQKVAFVWQKVWSWMPRYYIEIDGRVVCEIVKEFTFFRQSYKLLGTDWHLLGNFWAYDYALVDRNGQSVMALSKKWFSWGDSYELDIPNPDNELLCLCVALSVDAAIEQGQS